MGYYTDYTLEVCKGEGTFQPEELYAAVMKIDGGIFEEWGTNSWFANEQKWYSQEQDMYALSIKFPEVLFYLHGRGEDEDDLWDEYWQNGRYERNCAEIPPYDPEKMQQLYIDLDGRLTTRPVVEEEIAILPLPEL